MKNYILSFLLLSLFTLPSISHAQTNIEGSYPYNSNLSRFYYGKTEIAIRKNASLKVTFLEMDKEPFVFTPLEGDTGVFESYDENDGDWLRIEELEKGILIMYTLDPYRRIREKILLSKDRKLLKKFMKELKMKAPISLAKEIAGSWIKTKEVKEEIKEFEFLPLNPTSDFHAKNVGKIIFFSEKPTIGQEDQSKIKSKFKVGEPVWAIAYLPVPLDSKGGKDLFLSFQNNFGRSFKYAAIGVYKVDDDLLEEEKRIARVCSVKKLKEEDLAKNYIIFQVIPTASENEMEESGASFMSQQMSQMLKKYEYELLISLTNENGRHAGMITGTFFYDASAGTEELKNIYESIEAAQLERKKLPTPVFRDTNLEAEMIQQIELYAHAKGWDNKWVKAIIASNWTVMKGDYGSIEGKYIEAYCVFKNEDGCGYINFGFLKEYTGNGQYNTTIRQYDIGERGAVSCDKVK